MISCPQHQASNNGDVQMAREYNRMGELLGPTWLSVG